MAVGNHLVRRKISLPGVRMPLSVGIAIQGVGGIGNPSKVRFPPCIAKGDVVTFIADVEVKP